MQRGICTACFENFTLSEETCISVCGDNKKSKEEECDDGNQIDDDECNNSCLYVPNSKW